MEIFKILRILLSVSALALVGFFLKPTTTIVQQETDETQTPAAKAEVREKTTSERKPASALMVKADVYKPGIVRSTVKKTNFQDETVPDHFNHFSGGGSTYRPNSLVETQDNYTPPHDSLSEAFTEPQQTPPAPLKKAEQTLPGPVVAGPFVKKPEVTSPKDPLPIVPLTTGGGLGQVDILQNTCSASIAGGSFNHPIGVTLSCSHASVIKYCLGVDTGNGCCDPHTAGSVYNSKLGIGVNNESYCLSFFGDSPVLGLSDLYQQSYTFNSQLPDLQMEHQQVQYQTTQLAGKTFLTSLDFGKAGYGAGVINLKSHDPGPAATNLNCGEIVENYSALLAPAPVEILSLLDVSLENPATQLEIPLRLDQLDYGANFVTGYMLNDNYELPLYSCSTSTVVLNDFEFFEPQLAFGDQGDNSTREFTGGLTSFGFFEQETDIYRGPAGSSTQDKNGQILHYGMMGIFY